MERTKNIQYMFVTLDVSKLSGWLNADACCRVARRPYEAGGEVPAGRPEGGVGAVVVQAACTGRVQLKAWGPGHAWSARRTCSSCF